MWTNVFKIGGLHHISWFQFLPNESELNSLPDKSVKVDQKAAASWLVLSSHLQLQKEGFLSTWTNSFVGPWDPSQGLHNPDEKIKLWLFLPGHYSTVVEKAQPAVSRLRVLASGLWVAPGDSEEVAAALSHALRNCVERALKALSYMRYGDVFARYYPFSHNEDSLRRGQPVIEFFFTSTEEAVFVHAVISSKHVRALASGDIEKISKRSSHSSGNRLPVVVSPHGMRGRLTGCCPSDLVKQVYLSSGKCTSSNGIVALPYHVSQDSGCQLRGLNYFVEVTIGCPATGTGKTLRPHSNSQKSLPGHNMAESQAVAKVGQSRAPDICERMFIYPSEAVLVPVMQTAYAKSSLKRFWLQNWIGPSLSVSSSFIHCDSKGNSRDVSWIESNGVRTQHGYRSSSNSNNSSLSSISSSSSDSDYRAGDLEADADSLMCRQSGLSSSDQSHNVSLKTQGLKRPITGVSESYSQAGVTNSLNNDYTSMEVGNSAITGGNDQIGLQWGWDDDDRGGMDIQALLSEFGDFGDFFENDVLTFGEPPGTAESQALVFTGADCGDIGNSPCTSVMDLPEQMLAPVGYQSFDSFNPPPSLATIDDSVSKPQEVIKGTESSYQVNSTPASSTGEFDHLIKAEAMMTFAPEYGAVEAHASEISNSVFASPYIPKSRKVETANSSTNSYVYCANPPSSPLFGGSDENSGMAANFKTSAGKHDATSTLQSKKYYTHVDCRKDRNDKKLPNSENCATQEAQAAVSAFSVLDSTNTVKSVQSKSGKTDDGSFKAENVVPSIKTLFATEVECLMCQAFMCKIRHTLLSSNNPPVGSRFSASTILSQPPADSIVTIDNMSSKYEVKKKESIPARIAGDIDVRLLDGSFNSPVGVLRSASKGSKLMSSGIEACQSGPHNSYVEENMLSYGLRQPLQELLDGMALLVQQATSFVDVSLDADCNDGPFGWLALQEQWRRGFACGPSMAHAGCGGLLASCHSLDIAGVELVDPLSTDVQASFAISLLQSDVKSALKSAFGTLDGPLSVTDWCKGRAQSNDSAISGDGSLAESTASASECPDSSNTVTLSVGEPISPSPSSAVGSSSLKDGSRGDEATERRLSQDALSESEQLLNARLRPTIAAVPYPGILVGYQDDWLKTSPSSLQLWEKAPFEPYAMPKNMLYYVVCPDIDPLTKAATDFFQQLGTVYDTCKLGTHSPHSLGNEMEIDSGKNSSSGFVLIDCPQSMKIDSSSASMLGSISDYFLSLSNGWDLESFLKSLSKVLRTLKLSSCLNPKDGKSGPCTVIYVVCPFPEPLAVLQTVVESSTAIGSVMFSSDKERRSTLHNQVGKALSYSAAVDEAFSNVLTLSGFCIPKLVLQIVPVDAIFRVTSPPLSELVILKDIAFTVYNKARKISRGSSNDMAPSSLSSRSHPVLMQMTSPVPGMWKDYGARGSSFQREGELDASLRHGTWDSSWQTSRAGGIGCDPNRIGDFVFQDEIRYLFEPLFILAEPGSLDRGLSFPVSGNLASESSKHLLDDGVSGSGEVGSSSMPEMSESDGSGSCHQKLHCCYGWTEDWRWLVCIWTDSRGELLDSYIHPFGGISSRQDTKGLQSLFVQILQQGCQILQACAPDASIANPRDFVIARIGCFFELECQEWQKALYAVGGSEVKKWSLQLRRSVPDGVTPSSNGTSLQQQEMNLIQERTLPSSPSPLYSPHSKASAFIKGGLVQPNARQQLIGGHAIVDNSRGLLQWVQSISFVSVSIDHSLQLVVQAESASQGANQSSGVLGQPSYLEGYTPVKSLSSTSSSYVFIPSPNMRFLPPTILQLPTCLTAESPPLAHLLHSKGSAVPLSTGFVVSKAVPSMRRDARNISKEEWPSVLSVSLVDYYGGNRAPQEKALKGGGSKAGGGKGLNSETRDFETETHLVLENIAAELHALSWMTVSPAYLERRSALPLHCDMVLRLRRLLHFADKEVSRLPEKAQV
nr:mediator of RNA polymerase II transcription subunit 13 isoform X1 [Ipomoea trifida]